MKQIVILSGKGGTGKTSFSAAFAHMANPAAGNITAVMVDADVDAANLSLILKPVQSQENQFWGGSLAEINRSLCTGCGACIPVCRYDAILPDQGKPDIYWIDPIACDGCAACIYACPVDAIKMIPQQEGLWYQSSTSYGTLFHAELFPGRENSGKLVTLIKQHARLLSEDTEIPLVILDGPPGIGCPVISACAGSDLALIVSEPSLAGIHDLDRILKTVTHFKIPAGICINKSDIYPEGADMIRRYATENGFEVVGDIPFDAHIHQAMLQGTPVTVMYPESSASAALIGTWNKVLEMLEKNNKGGR